ncbi:hypothetical protein Syun_004342 [Stephania yunnanensis]|uniref:Uncharacterized protein n=1 Tax=Stephania yunnanensis TaxID=152371 RepID=A0AAP0L5D4_9MAGN
MRELYHAELGVHELEEMVCHADVDMDDREAMMRYNVMTTVRGHKSGMDDLHVAIRGYNVMSTDHPDGHVHHLVARQSTSCYAFVLVHRGEARTTAVSVCESRSRRRGDPKLSQRIFKASSGGEEKGLRWRKRWPTATEMRGGGENGWNPRWRKRGRGGALLGPMASAFTRGN